MKQSWSVFTRDVKRILRTRKAWVIVVGVLVTPALYAWFNINAFWDPYENTSNITVAVVNLDKGAENDLTGKVNIGDEVVKELKANHQLGWQFMDEADAHDAVESGDAYAAIVIPAEFSSDLLSLTTGSFTQPALEYFVNEKNGMIGPKITDVGASTLDAQITSSFKEQVADAATQAIKDTGDSIELKLFNAQDKTVNAFDQTTKTLENARTSLANMQSGIEDSRGTISSARKTLTDVRSTLDDVKESMTAAQSALVETQRELVAFTDAASNAYLTGATLLADSAASAQTSITHLTQELDQAGVRLDASITEIQKSIEANKESIENLEALINDASVPDDTKAALQSALDQLKAQNAANDEVLTKLKNLSSSTAGAATSVNEAVSALSAAMDNTKNAAGDMRKILTETVPAVNSAVSQLSASASAFTAAISAQQEVLTQADGLLAGIDTQLVATGSALTSFDEDVKGLITGVKTARADVLAMSAASEWGMLTTITTLDPDQIASFVSSPVTVNEIQVFPIKTYGSAMAALFTNLSLWIGAFVLMVIFKVEVDTEGLRRITVRQAYMGRFFLFALLGMLQALIVSVGNLVIGVQTTSAVAYVGTSMLISIVYTSIIYALSSAFGHVGRGLCVLFIIMQIPGASGLYPIELMPGFFRTLYPLLPFSYGIDALRETIGGFYGGHYWKFMGVLALMSVIAFIIGITLRTRFGNFNRLFNRQIAETDLMIGEKVAVVGPGYRLIDVIHALKNRDEYREDLAVRERAFTHHYPKLLKSTLIIGAIGMVVLGIIAWALPGGKALMLGLWVAWSLLVIVSLIVLEYIKQSFIQAAKVADMPEEELREAVMASAITEQGEEESRA
ncbi:YhgE/Pip family protein [Leucobacter sp. 1207-22]|uniref:YhgE/Pip family protein n=1 Tax=Leucobacter sp. 1207-22 TaxID=2604456 RepID=UPI004062E4EB